MSYLNSWAKSSMSAWCLAEKDDKMKQQKLTGNEICLLVLGRIMFVLFQRRRKEFVINDRLGKAGVDFSRFSRG